MTSRIASACDTFVHAADMTPADIAASIRDAGAHVVVDLMGHTMGARVGIVAAKPAPIVVNYLGCPCSSGGDTTDYVMVDAVVAPLEERGAFSEARVYVCCVSVCVECVYCGRVLCGSVSQVLDPACVLAACCCCLCVCVCLCGAWRCRYLPHTYQANFYHASVPLCAHTQEDNCVMQHRCVVVPQHTHTHTHITRQKRKIVHGG